MHQINPKNILNKIEKISLSHVYVKTILEKLSLIKNSSQNFSSPETTGLLTRDWQSISCSEIFIAYKGASFDSHNILMQARKNSPQALLIFEDQSFQDSLSGPWLLVSHARKVWSYLEAASYGDPQKKITFLGVTGTNGKSSCVWLSRSLLKLMGIPTLSFGTLGCFLGEEEIETSHTTPDPDFFFPFLKLAVEKNINHVCMEVSSHSLAQEKLAPILFSAAAFTSFSRDHLDFHSTMEAYFATKSLLFEKYLAKDSISAFHQSVLPAFAEDFFPGKKNLWSYGLDYPSHAQARTGVSSLHAKATFDPKVNHSSLSFKYQNTFFEGEIPLLADCFIENFLASWLLSSHLIGKPIPASFWPNFPQIPGRFEIVSNKPLAIVDYAHTPDALERALFSLRKLCQGKLWVVFGCGGDRDKGKRPLMANIASSAADNIVLTSDNPRTEDPLAILKDIQTGLKWDRPVSVIPDRREAICFALQKMNVKDAVLIAGKGHENYQIIGNQKKFFDDRFCVKEFLNC